MKRAFLLCLIGMYAACAGPSSDPHSRAEGIGMSEVVDFRTRAIRGSRPVPNDITATPAFRQALKDLGWVWGEDGRGCGARGEKGTREAAMKQLKTRAANMGATHVHIRHEREMQYVPGCPMGSNRIKITGKAYRPYGP